MTGPFASVAVDYARAGLNPFPCGASSGKHPLVNNWPKRRSLETVEKYADRFPDANIGIPTGPLTKLTVVDVDDVNLASAMVERCGPTPLITGTPRGGQHLIYRHAGEKNVIRLDGVKVDIRGAGGMFVAPPSIRPDSGKAYRPIWGDLLADIPNLPTVTPGSLPLAVSKKRARGQDIEPVMDGQRDAALFARCRTIGNDCPDEGTLIEQAFQFNASCVPPLETAEVLKVARKVWQYVTQGKCIAPGTNHAIVTGNEIDDLFGKPDAALMLLDLRRSWLGSEKPFHIVLPGYGERLGLSRRRAVQARDDILALNKIFLVYQGGNGPGDFSLYCFSPSLPKEGGGVSVVYTTSSGPLSREGAGS